jgi:hypothetical protein
VQQKMRVLQSPGVSLDATVGSNVACICLTSISMHRSVFERTFYRLSYSTQEKGEKCTTQIILCPTRRSTEYGNVRNITNIVNLLEDMEIQDPGSHIDEKQGDWYQPVSELHEP